MRTMAPLEQREPNDPAPTPTATSATTATFFDNLVSVFCFLADCDIFLLPGTDADCNIFTAAADADCNILILDESA